MSRIDMRRLAAFLLAVLLMGASAEAQETEQQDIIDASQLTPQQINYKTTEVIAGSFVKEATSSASEYYPLTYDVQFGQSNAKFVEFTVKRGETVKAGDVLARFYITGSDVAFTRMEKNLTRTKEETEKGISTREEAISRQRAQIAAMADGYEKEKALLALRKLETELEKYIHSQNYSIANQTKAYEEEKARRANNVLISPVDGVVTEMAYKKADDAVSASETLVTISSEEVLLLRVKNDGGSLRYNMPVVVKSGNNKQQVILSGRVVAADDVIPEQERTGYAFIELDPYDTEEIRLRALKVTVNTIQLDNVTLVKRTAATLEAGKYYVTKLKDGMVQKRYIKFGMSNTEYTWAMTGVEAGETLIID